MAPRPSVQVLLRNPFEGKERVVSDRIITLSIPLSAPTKPAPAAARRRRLPWWAAELATLFNTWIARRAERRALRELADRNDQHMLDDIGVTREQARDAAAKWFWQP